MDYSQGIQFETSIINMEEAQELKMNNQLVKNKHKRCRCGSIKHSGVTSKDFPVGIAVRKDKISALGMGISQSEAKKATEDAASDKESKFLAEQAAGEG